MNAGARVASATKQNCEVENRRVGFPAENSRLAGPLGKQIREALSHRVSGTTAIDETAKA